MSEPPKASTTNADALLETLRLRPGAQVLADARKALQPLRDAREFERLAALAEAIGRERPDDALARKFYAQALIDTGKVSVAIDVLNAAIARLAPGDAQEDELWGLLGRAHKQLFLDAADRSTDLARSAIERAAAAYRAPFERDPSKNYWHGINLCAVLHAARKRGVRIPGTLEVEAVARDVHARLDGEAPGNRGAWWHATRAEAHVALGDWTAAETALRDYVADGSVSPFQFASTLRQLREVWEIQSESAVGAGLVQILEAELARKDEGVLALRPDHLRAMRAAPEPSADQRQRVLGDDDAQTVRWYRLGLDRAASVAAIRLIAGKRFGTGFAVRAGDFGIEPAREVLVITNFHVVNRRREDGGEAPSDVEILFEAAGMSGLGPFHVREVVAESPFQGDGLDYALLRLQEDLAEVPALPLAPVLPRLTPPSRVIVIGHPRGDELHIAFQDNHLLDHEGPPAGKPPVPARVRVQYHTPTAEGSSGSPAFDALWRVIALHHRGEKYEPKASAFGIRKLNGIAERHSANEGIWIGSIREQVQALALRLAAR